MKKLYYFHYFTLIFNVFVVQGSEIFTKEFTAMQNKLFSDVFELKEGLDRVQIAVDVLNKRHAHQLNDLKDIIAPCPEVNVGPETIQYSEDVCDELLYYTNETIVKYDQFNNQLRVKLEEIQRNQTQSLDLILKNSAVENECQDLKPKEPEVEPILFVIEDKVNKMEQKLHQFETLEEKLILQQKKYEKIYEDQLQILQKIKEKLQQNEEKFMKYQKEVPDMNNFSNKINNMANWRHWHHRGLPRQ